jgi:hypothetical protein
MPLAPLSGSLSVSAGRQRTWVWTTVGASVLPENGAIAWRTQDVPESAARGEVVGPLMGVVSPPHKVGQV